VHGRRTTLQRPPVAITGWAMSATRGGCARRLRPGASNARRCASGSALAL